MTIPPGWTDDMNIVLPEHRSPEEVVEFVLSMAMNGADHELIQQSLVEEFGICPDDAELAWDRVCGGVTRAATNRLENCPDQYKDRLAWLSFQRSRQDRSIIVFFHPDYAGPVGTKRPGAVEPAAKETPRVIDAAGDRPWWKFW